MENEPDVSWSDRPRPVGLVSNPLIFYRKRPRSGGESPAWQNTDDGGHCLRGNEI